MYFTTPFVYIHLNVKTFRYRYSLQTTISPLNPPLHKLRGWWWSYYEQLWVIRPQSPSSQKAQSASQSPSYYYCYFWSSGMFLYCFASFFVVFVPRRRN